VGLLPLLVSPLPAAAGGSGTLFALDIQRSSVAIVDPASGSLTPLADVSLPPDQPGPGWSSSMVVDPSTHQLFLVRIVSDFTVFPPVEFDQLLSVNTQSGAVAVSPALARPINSLALDASNGALFGLTADCCPSQIVRLDPVSGTETPLVDLPGDRFSIMAIAPATHLLYVDSDSGPFPPTSTMLTVNTLAGDIAQSPPLTIGVRSLVYDTSSGALFGVTFFPPHFIRIDPSTGVETPLGNYDFGFFLEPGTAIDSASHTIFFVQDVFDDPILGPIAHIASVNDQTGAGVLGGTTNTNIAAIAFEPTLVTPEGLSADVRSALESGAIDNSGVASSLLAELNAAAAARSRGDCGTAAKLYTAFINDVTAQSGKHIAAGTASQLASEAQVLIANCP
jgi:hypothetical protein